MKQTTILTATFALMMVFGAAFTSCDKEPDPTDPGTEQPGTDPGGNGDECILTKEMVQAGGTLPKCTYIVKNGFTITGTHPNLTILPGTVIKFGKNEYNQISFFNTSQNIIAAGTADEPIIFTSAEVTPKIGDWGGFSIGGGSRLEYCTFEYGAKNDLPTPAARSMVSIRGGAPTIKNCTFRHSESNGLDVTQCNSLAAFDNNTFTDCGETIPLTTTAGDRDNAFPMKAKLLTTETGAGYGSGNVFNTSKGIGVHMLLDDWKDNMTIIDAGVPYYWYNVISVDEGDNYTFEAGVHIVFYGYAGTGSIYVDREGTLTAVGTADKPIKFSGYNNEKGNWGGIFLSDWCTATLSYCEIANTGAQPGTLPPYGVYIESWHEAGRSVTNCHFRKSSSAGIIIDSSEADNKTVVSGNTFEDVDGGNIVYE